MGGKKFDYYMKLCSICNDRFNATGRWCHYCPKCMEEKRKSVELIKRKNALSSSEGILMRREILNRLKDKLKNG
jgi:predicted amidophosphoribosyltransferase